MTNQADLPAAKFVHGNVAYSEGRVESGDVSLFYRRFGKPGKTPLLIMHGVNYFDSFDWIGVASKLATDREVVAFDHRGFGESTWSPSKNYSIDTKFIDIQNMMKALGWVRPIVMGHSGSGRLSVSFAAAFPDLLSRLIVVDSNFGNGELQPAGVGKKSKIYPNVEAVMAHYAELDNPPRMALDRARVEQALVKVDGGYRIKCDPDYGNVVPISGDAKVRPIRELPAWEQLPKIKCPFLMVQGLKSSRWTPEIVTKLKTTFPNIQWATADSMHDIPYYAPDELVAGVRKFIADI